MHKLALKILPLAELPGTASAEGRQLDSSISVRDACIALSHQKKPVRQVICIAGHPGSGRSTYTQAVFQELVHSGSMSYSEILFLVVGPYDSISSVWNSGIEIAKANNDRGVVALLASNTTARDAKLKAMVRLLNNFKTICFDDLDAKNEELCSFLLTLVKKLNNNVICVSHLNHSPCIKIADVCITVNGLYPEAVKSLVLKNTKIDRKRLESIYKSFKHNPTAIQLYLNSCLLFGKCEVTSTAEEDPPTCSVLEMIWEQLSDLERHALVQLSELRQPLPMKAEAGTLARVVQIGLVKSKNMSMSGRGTCRLISMANCVKNFVQSKNSSISPLEMDKKFNVFNCWTTLLTDELLGLLEDAKNNSWPFIPEKWQYVTNVGEKDSHNVKELITLKNKDFPNLTQFDILQECLHHSIIQKDYENMAAIIFVLDRFIYWQGGSKMLLSIVDTITKGNPQLPIAPQLVIRKARILRTSGDLQGAEKVLDTLLNAKEKLGAWKYKDDHDHHLVRAVCVQIKGEIQASLGQWVIAASLLLESIHLFRTLPKVDKKGLSCSLGLLVNTLQSMSVEEYQYIATKHSLVSPHPYLEAHVFAREAAQLAVFTPLFLARHKRRAGEMMLEYSQIFTDHRRSQFLNEALKELKESLEAHKSIESLQSREQYYEFIGALYKASCGFELQNRQEKTAQDLKNVSILLYDHYCRHQTAVVHDAFSQRLITSALLTLGLPVFIKDTLPVDSIQSIPILPKEQSSLTTETNFKRSSIKPIDATIVDRTAATLQTVNMVECSTVDRLKTTVITVDEKYSGIPDDQRNKSHRENNTDVLSNFHGEETYDLTATSVHECESSRYDPVHSSWRTQRTLVYIGEQLNLAKGKKGAQRDPFMIEYLNQDEPLGKYVGKKYKKPLGPEQYEEDVRCQMTARYYVGLFNQDLYHKGVEVSQIQFLPVVMLRLLNNAGQKTSCIYNVEPYIHGDFTKLTNNWSFVDKKGQGSKLVLAFSHFTYERSNRTLLIVDHQGWTSSDHVSTTFLTDPQIHCVDKKFFGTGNLGVRGILKFWEDMHTECNDICRQLGLQRPDPEEIRKSGHIKRREAKR